MFRMVLIDILLAGSYFQSLCKCDVLYMWKFLKVCKFKRLPKSTFKLRHLKISCCLAT